MEDRPRQSGGQVEILSEDSLLNSEALRREKDLHIKRQHTQRVE